MNIVHFEELTSTNDEAMRGDYPHNTLIVTNRQSAGRGQRGNRWESQSDENLTFSLVLEPHHIPVIEQYRISMMAALAASDAICSWGVDCRIKWSNDLYVGDCKIGGILIEHTLMGETLTKSVVGIGINVLQREFPINLPNPTSLVNENCDNCVPEELLHTFAEKFTKRYSQSTTQLYTDYMARLWRLGVMADFSDKNGRFKAEIVKVNPLTGMLTLRTIAGNYREYWFKEVEFLL